jgi:tetratricopeptide (TPR) repeat protein
MLNKKPTYRRLPPLLLILVIISSYSFFQKDLNAPVTSQKRIIDNEIYSKDSTQLLSYWDLYWRFDNNDLHDSAIDVCNKMIDLGKEILPFRFDSVLFERYAKAYGGIGYHLMKLGDYDKALDYSFQSYDTLRSKLGENHIRITEVLVGISENYTARGDYDLGLKYIFKSLEIMHQILPENHHYFGNNYNNLALIYHEAGQYDKAIQWIKLAIKAHKKAKRPGSKNGVIFPRAMHYLGSILLQTNEEQEAEKIILESIKLNNEAAGDPVYNTLAYYKLGKTYFQTREFGKSKQFYYKFLAAINTHKEVREDAPIEGDGYFGLAQIEEEQKNYTGALRLYSKAINSWIKHYGTGGRDKVISGLHKKGDLLLQLKKSEKALESYHEALSYLVPSVDSKDIYLIPTIDEITPSLLALETIGLKTVCLSKIYANSSTEEQLNQILSSAELFINTAFKLQESYQWENSKYSIIEKIRPISELYLQTGNTLYQQTGEQHYLNKMFSIVQKSKAAILQETVRDIQAKEFANISPENRKKENTLKTQLAQYEKEIFDWSQIDTLSNTEELVDLNTKALDIKLSIDSLNKAFLHEYPEYLSSKSHSSFTNVSDLKEQLNPNDGIIEYFLGDATLYIFSITQNDVHFSFQSIEEDFVKQVIDFRAIFQNYNPGIKKQADIKKDYYSFVQNGKSLYDVLLAGVLPKMSSKKIIIIPDGELNYLPFHVLLTQTPKKEIISNFSYGQLPYLFLEKNIRY